MKKIMLLVMLAVIAVTAIPTFAQYDGSKSKTKEAVWALELLGNKMRLLHRDPAIGWSWVKANNTQQPISKIGTKLEISEREGRDIAIIVNKKKVGEKFDYPSIQKAGVKKVDAIEEMIKIEKEIQRQKNEGIKLPRG